MSTTGITFRAEHNLPPTPPCESCPKMDYCRGHETACRAFRHYISTGAVVPLWQGQRMKRLAVQDEAEEV